MQRLAKQSGQAAVELVAILPVLVLVAAGVWQCALAGYGMWGAHSAARAAARANAVGGDPYAAARARLPGGLRRGLDVRKADGGDVVVRVRIPEAVKGLRVGGVSARSHFDLQR